MIVVILPVGLEEGTVGGGVGGGHGFLLRKGAVGRHRRRGRGVTSAANAVRTGSRGFGIGAGRVGRRRVG